MSVTVCGDHFYGIEAFHREQKEISDRDQDRVNKVEHMTECGKSLIMNGR